MENDYRITKLHGTLIGDNRIPDLPAGEKTKVFSSTNGKTAWVDLPTDIGKDANGFAILCHDGTEITGQRKTVKLADVRDNGAVIGRDQTTSAPQTDELITKAYADKEYGAPISVESNAEDLPVTITLTDEQSTAIENQIANGHFNVNVTLSATGQKFLFNQAVTLAEGGVLYYAMAMISFSLFSAVSIIMTYSKSEKTLTLSQQDPLFKNETSLRVIDNKVALYSGDNDTGALFGKSYSVAKINGNSILNDPDTIPVSPSYYAPETINTTATPKVLTSKSGAFEWSDLPSGGKSVSPCLNLMNMDTGEVRTSITEEEKTNLEKGLYNSVIYRNPSVDMDFYSSYFPETAVLVTEGTFTFSKYNLSVDETTQKVTVSSSSVYNLSIGEKSADGTYPITIEETLKAPFGGWSTSSSSFEEATLSQLSGFKGQYKALHITDCNVVFNFQEIGEITSNSVYFVGFVNSETQLEGTVWTIFGGNPVCLCTGTFYITNGVINGGHCTIGSLNSVSVGSLLTFGGTRSFNSKDATNAIGLYGVQGCEYAGKVDVVSNGATAKKSALTIISNINKEATGESAFCEMDGLFEGYGLGRMVLKKDANNSPQFKSFTTWLPPVTANSDGKALIVTDGNAQWTDLPGGSEIEVIEGTITSTQGNQNEFTISVVPKGKIFILKMFLGNILMSMADGTTYTGFCYAGNSSFGVILDVSTKSGGIIAINTAYWMNADSTQNGKVLSIIDGAPSWSDPPRYEHTITIKNSAGAILWSQTMRNSSNTIVNSYTNLKTLFGGATYAGFGEYCQLNLHGGTEGTDKLIKADGTEVTLASLGAIVYTDDCFLPK